MNIGSLGELVLKSHSEKETLEYGKALAPCLGAGDVLALLGSFGAGKTTLVKGLVEGLDGRDGPTVTSPSFVLMHEYPGRCPLYHIDCYRLESLDDARAAGLEEFLYTEGIAVVEWADKIKGILPDHALFISIELGGKPDERRILVLGESSRLGTIRKALSL